MARDQRAKARYSGEALALEQHTADVGLLREQARDRVTVGLPVDLAADTACGRPHAAGL